MENRGYLIYEVGNLGGNDKDQNKIYCVRWLYGYKRYKFTCFSLSWGCCL